MRETCKLKQHKEDELGGEVLPQQLTSSSDIGVKVFLSLRALHGVHHQVHQLLFQHRATLLMLGGEVCYRIKKTVRRREEKSQRRQKEVELRREERKVGLKEERQKDRHRTE